MPKRATQVTKSLDRMKRNTYKTATPYIYGKGYFYVFGWTSKDKVVCWGPFSTQHDADSALAELKEGEVFPLDTRDLSRATREIKAELVRRGEDPDEALKRVLHKRD